MKKIFSLLVLFLAINSHLAAQQDDLNGDAIYTLSGPDIQSAVQFRAEVNPQEAGDAIEGDYLAQPAYTPSGDRFLVPNRNTNNVTVFDASSMEIIANIPTWETPFDIGVTDEYVIVPCFGSNNVTVFELENYTGVASFPTANHPVKVIISPDGSRAMVGTDADEGLFINLDDLTAVTIPDFPCDQYRFSFITSNTRNTIFWTEFGIAPDNSYIINGAFDDGLRTYDPETGDVIATLPSVPYSGLIRLSGDQSTWIAMGSGNDALISQIAAPVPAVLSQVAITGQSVWTAYGGPGVNFDGSRAIVPAYPGNLALVRFDMDDFITIPVGTSPNWVGQTADYSMGVVGSYYLSLVDFATGAVVSQNTGRPIANGAVSPSVAQLIAFDPLRFESIHVYDFTVNNSLSYVGNYASGSELEADATYSVQMISDTRGIAMNSISGTMSIFNYETQELEALIPLESYETYYAAVTEDAAYALVARRLLNDVAIVDLNTYEIVASVSSGGEKPDQVFILPNQEYAYVLNAGGTDRIGVIKIDGANSSLEESFVVGNVGISWTNYGIRSNIVFSPDQQYAILPAPFDEQVQIIDLESHDIVAELDIEGFPLRVATGNSDFLGDVAAVMMKNTGEIAVITNIGPGANITEGFDIGSNPVDLCFGYSEDGTNKPGFFVASADDQAVNFFDLDLFTVTASTDYGPDHAPAALAYSQEAGRFTLCRSTISGGMSFLEFSEDVRVEFSDIAKAEISLQNPVPSIAMVPSLSQDRILVFQTDIVGSGLEGIQLSPVYTYTVFPQPSTGMVHFIQAELQGSGFIRVFDNTGKLLIQKEHSDLSNILLDATSLPVGHLQLPDF